MRPLSLLALVLSVGAARAQPVPTDFTVPENPVPANSYAEVRYPLPKKSDTSVVWSVSPEPTKSTYATEIEGEGADATTASVLHFNGPPGQYVVKATIVDFAAKKVSQKSLTVTIGAAPPKPPVPPGPGPGPTPPPDPGPQPSAELKQKVAAAFAKDAGKPADAAQLAALYTEAAKLAQKKRPDGTYECPTSRELLRRVREASTGLIGDDVLVSVRTVAAAELAAVAGMSSDEGLTDAARAAVADTYRKLAACLEGLGK